MDAETLVRHLRALPTDSIVAPRVLELLDDDDSSAHDVGRVIESDPALSAKVLRLANSPWAGLADHVTVPSRAVAVLGYATVRSLLLATMYDLGSGGPPGYWLHSVTAAAAAARLARPVGVDEPLAFSAGLLHDLGDALLFQVDPARWRSTVAAADTEQARLTVEQATWGLTHAEAGRLALEASRFPDAFVDAVGAHHSLPSFDEPSSLSAVVAVAELAATPDAAVDDVLTTFGVDVGGDAFRADVHADVERLSGFLLAG